MNRMDSKNKHPFAITCRKCGSNRVEVYAYGNRDLEIRCKNCEFFLCCGYYDAEEIYYSEMAVKGYKAFNPDWTCLSKKYTCPGNHKEYGELSICFHGMHFCKRATDCFKYYSFDPRNHIAEVVAHGNVIEDGDICCTDHLEIVREIPWNELLTIIKVESEGDRDG